MVPAQCLLQTKARLSFHGRGGNGVDHLSTRRFQILARGRSLNKISGLEVLEQTNQFRSIKYLYIVLLSFKLRLDCTVLQ